MNQFKIGNKNYENLHNVIQCIERSGLTCPNNFENNSRLLELKAVIWVSTYTMATVYWCCTVRHQEKCRKSWPTGTHVRSLVPNSEYICEIRKFSRSKHNFESNSKIFRYGEIARKNCDGMSNMLSKDFTFNQPDFRLFDE